VSSHQSTALPTLAILAALFVTSAQMSQTEEKTGKSAPISVPHTTASVPLDCNNDDTIWAKVPRINISKDSGGLMEANRKKPLALEFLASDPSAAEASVPADIQSELDSFHAEYRFQWDEQRLYGYVEVQEQDLDTRHLKTSDRTFRRDPYAAAFEDMFHSSVIVEVGAPSWHRWITEMHAHVRPPKANPMTSMFFGRNNGEEKFRELAGSAVACPTEGGWIAKFSIAWLPYYDWKPKEGATAGLKLIAPLPHSGKGYVLVDVVPFVLAN
jgi:hypothetical protein